MPLSGLLQTSRQGSGWDIEDPRALFQGAMLFEESARIRVEGDGRALVPAEVRHQLGLREGQPSDLHVEGGKTVLETGGAIFSRVQARFRSIPPEISLADELIRERRREALLEAEE